MATLTEVEVLRSQLDDISTLAQRDVDDIFRQLVAGLELSPQELRDVFRDVLPGVINPYASVAASVTQEFYFQDREQQQVKSYYRNTPALALPTQGAIRALAGYGTAVLLANPEATLAAIGKIAGGMQRLLFNVQRDNEYALASRDPAQPRYQRMTTSSEPCEFCIMLASRGAVYDSESTAGAVVGRGVPVEATRGLRGGQGKGIRPRGPKLIGERFHDNDRCVAVAVHAGRRQEMSAKAAEHFELYSEARARLEPRDLKFTEYKLPDGSLKRRYRWEDDAGHIVSSDDQTKRLLAEMRKLRNQTSV